MTVRIRPYELSDAPALYEAARESYLDIGPWMPWCHADYQLAEAQTWVTAVIDGAKSGTIYDFAILIDDRFAGACGINQINPHDRVANLGYWLRSSCTGKGVAAWAARHVIDWAFDNTVLNRIEIVVAVNNARSLRVAEKVGATRDAVLPMRTMANGVATDAVMHSVLRSDRTYATPLK